jgi:peptidoglycan biosynthesis protein MviN/MurJ (putative lipid II flippase)
MGVQGLALSYTVSNVLNATVLFVVLHRRLGSLDENRIAATILRVIGITILMAVAVQLAKQATVSLGFTLTRAYGVFAQAAVASIVGVASYVIFAIMFRLEEASMLARVAQKIGFRRKGVSV